MKSIVILLSTFVFPIILSSCVSASPNDQLNLIGNPSGAKLVLDEDWAAGIIEPEKWYCLHKRWGSGNNGVVKSNVYIDQDTVKGRRKKR